MRDTRYFSGTNGTVTVFRASPTKVYRSASFGGGLALGGLAFSGKPPSPNCPIAVVEITKAEFDALNRAKTRRIEAAGRKYVSPQDSWVDNADLDGTR